MCSNSIAPVLLKASQEEYMDLDSSEKRFDLLGYRMYYILCYLTFAISNYINSFGEPYISYTSHSVDAHHHIVNLISCLEVNQNG
jgi:hypothetical protein